MIALAAAGALGALWASLLHIAGMPTIAAVPLAMSAPVITVALAKRPGFAPRLLREDATVAILVFGVVVAMTPTITQGWQSALALNVTDPTRASSALLPVGIMSFVGAAMTLGGLWSLWRRG